MDRHALERPEVELHQTQYEHSFPIYTDGSSGSSVGAAIYIPVNDESYGARLPDYCSIFTAEAMAIRMGLHYTLQHKHTQTVIYSDSLSVITSIQNTSTPPTIIRNIQAQLCELNRLGYKIRICWIPGHSGVLGNEKADQAAKLAAVSPGVPEYVKIYPEDFRTLVDNILLKKWQQFYDEHNKARFYKRIEPHVSFNKKFTDQDRRKEILLSRFRLGHVNTNRRLHRIGRRDKPDCPYCSEVETIEHLLYECRDTHLISADIPLARALGGGIHSQAVYDGLVLLGRHEMLT
jgi:ribonuclease HI